MWKGKNMSSLTLLFGPGFDSALCCVAIGTMPQPWSERFRLALAFGMCDAAASGLGSLFAWPLPNPPAIVVYLCCAALLGLAARHSPRVLYVLPLVLSLDDLVSGLPLEGSVVAGILSAMLSLLGFSAGAVLYRCWQRRPREPLGTN
jgi:hypothetical protein